MKKNNLFAALLAFVPFVESSPQQSLYNNTFPLSDVKLLDGPFRNACSLNIDVLLKYDVDRLLAPYMKEAGLTPKAESFQNWIGLDGHVGGHYLSALAIHYASTGNQKCHSKMEYMLSELEKCQNANGNGYVGGVPGSVELWREVKAGNVGAVWNSWVPWYNIHKSYAGLRDAWLYGRSERARLMFIKFCDWGLDVISGLDDNQMESMLNNEFGGMNEIYADAYQITGEKKYLDAAKRFTHRQLFESMKNGVDNLDNMHANTQVPKAVGFARVAEVAEDADYKAVSEFFWDKVVNERSIAIGGNSRREHFPSKDDWKSYIDEREGPESCNTYNMLKLSEDLFRMDPDAKYADYYEKALFNHILSTQHPEHGGYVYFTPARPGHYRVYSSPNSAMWCCVGSGMENHGKYGQFIYTHDQDDLYVNLFVASELEWKDKGIKVIQDTKFPEEETVKIKVKVSTPTRFRMLVRNPGWATDGISVKCMGWDFARGTDKSSYVSINRIWKDGDVVEINLPMPVRVEEMPNMSDYISIFKGPVLMGAKTDKKDMEGLVAGDGRWGHIASGALVSVFETPVIVGERKEIVDKLKRMEPVAGKTSVYRVPGLIADAKFSDIRLEPMYKIHDSRYMMYWLSMTASEYQSYKENVAENERRILLLDKRTVDAVSTGEQQPEVDHKMAQHNSQSGHFQGEPWRDARDGGYFEYDMQTKGEEKLALFVRYWGNETNNREFDILIDGQQLASENLSGKWNVNNHVDHEYAIPAGMLSGKESVKVRFQSKSGNTAGGVYFVRLLK